MPDSDHAIRSDSLANPTPLDGYFAVVAYRDAECAQPKFIMIGLNNHVYSLSPETSVGLMEALLKASGEAEEKGFYK